MTHYEEYYESQVPYIIIKSLISLHTLLFATTRHQRKLKVKYLPITVSTVKYMLSWSNIK